jgi:hypothetical protein
MNLIGYIYGSVAPILSRAVNLESGMNPNRKRKGLGRKTRDGKKEVSDYSLIIVLGGAVILSFVIIGAILFTTP